MTMFGHILVPLDGSNLAQGILPLVAFVSEKLGSRVTLLHLLERHARPHVHADRHLMDHAEAETYLRQVRQAFPAAVHVETHTHAPRVGDVAGSIVDHASEIGADLVALTTHGAGGLSRAVFGSIAQRVMERSRLPVLLRPPRGQPPHDQVRSILVPVDVVPDHAPGASRGIDVARALGASVLLVGVTPTRNSLSPARSAPAQLLPATTNVLLQVEQTQLRQRLASVESHAARQGVPCRAELLNGDPVDLLLAVEQREQPDLVVIASRGRSGPDAALNESLGERLCAQCRAPLLVFPV